MEYTPEYERPKLAQLQNVKMELPTTNINEINVRSFYHAHLVDAYGMTITPSDEVLMEIVAPDAFVDGSFLEGCEQSLEEFKMFIRVSHEINRAKSLFASTKNVEAQPNANGAKIHRSFYPPFLPLEGKTFSMMRSYSLKSIVQCPIKDISMSLSCSPGGSLKSFNVYPSTSLPDVCSTFCKSICLQLWKPDDFVRLTGSLRSPHDRYIPLPEPFIYEVRALFIAAWQLRDLSDMHLMELSNKLRGGFSEFFDNARNKSGKRKRLSCSKELQGSQTTVPDSSQHRM